MRTIIAGSRTVWDPKQIAEACAQCGWEITEVVSGGARGADNLGEEWAIANKIPFKIFPADWDRLGKSAGYKRNVQMADYAEALILVWDGQSRGSKHMLDIAKEKRLSICERIVDVNAGLV